MSTMSRTRLRLVQSKLSPGTDPQPDEKGTLWRCVLRVNTERDEFLFRAEESFELATIIALSLVDESPSCKMCGAMIVAIERVAKLWN